MIFNLPINCGSRVRSDGNLWKTAFTMVILSAFLFLQNTPAQNKTSTNNFFLSEVNRILSRNKAANSIDFLESMMRTHSASSSNLNSSALTTMPGEVDPSFNAGVMSPGTSQTGQRVEAIVVQPDGKHIIAGHFRLINSTGRNFIARLNEDGTTDESFSTGVGFNSSVFAVAVQPDGKIVVGGGFASFIDSSGTTVLRPRLARLNANGTLDSSFNAGVISGPVTGAVYALALQSDGKIVIAGDFTTVGGASRVGVARLNTDGSVDTSFAPVPGTNNPSPATGVFSIAIQPDGKIIIGGAFTTYNGVSRNGIARINTDGSLDTTFDPGTGVTTSGNVKTVALQLDGKILIGGGFTQFNGAPANNIARLNANGTKDIFLEGSNCNVNPIPSANCNTTKVGQITVLTDGKILVSADGIGVPNSGNTIYNRNLLRLNTNGSVDNTFASPGSENFSTLNPLGRHAVQADGKIITNTPRVIYQISQASGFAATYLQRHNSNGSIDTAYTAMESALSHVVNDILREPDGKILAVGNFRVANNAPRPCLARFNADGTLDSGFNARTDCVNQVSKVLRQPDGKYLIVGTFGVVNGINGRSGIARLNQDGSLDTSFNASPGTSGGVGYVYNAALQPDGKIIIVGAFSLYNNVARSGIARINTDGSLDTTFDPGTGIPTSPTSQNIYSLALQPDGKIVIGGNFTSYNGTPRTHVARVNADGSLDTTFNVGAGLGNSGGAYDIKILSDNRILIGGSFLTYNSVTRRNIARLNADGTLDASFGTADQQFMNGAVSKMHVQSNGSIIIGGTFESVGGQARRGVARLNANGSLDASFGSGMYGANPAASQAFGAPAVGLAVDEANDLMYFGSSFSTFNNIGRGSIVRLFTGTGGFSISGQITGTSGPLAGVPVALTGSSSANTTTDANGNYAFPGVSAGGNYTVTPSLVGFNFSPPNRSYTNLAANQTAQNFTAQQICNYVLSPSSPQTVAAAGGNLNIAVTAPSGCAWTAASSAAWINVNSGTPGNGNGTVNITIQANTGAARTGTLTIAGQTYTIEQAQACTYSLNPPAASVAATAGSGSFTVTTQAGCAWNAVSNNAFLTTSSSGNGSGAVNYSYAANTGAARSAMISVGGQTFTLNQSAGNATCTNGVAVTLPNQNAPQNTTITIPVSVGDTSGRGITSFDFDLRFDSSIVRPLAAQPVDNAGTLSANFTVTPNANTAGRLVVSAFGINPLSGSGTLLNLKFEIIGSAQQSAALNWQTFQFNEGEPCATLTPGQITVVNGSIAGAINYHFIAVGQQPKPMANVSVVGAGTPQVSATTNAAGAYLLNNFGAGAYTVTPAKSGDVNGISSQDAARVAQFVAGLVTLTPNQQVAADATNNGTVSSQDASRIAQYVAGITVAGATGQWKFAPASRTYNSVTTQVMGENYDAILVGEVTGNWAAPATLIEGNDESLPPVVDKKPGAGTESVMPPVAVSLPNLNAQPGAMLTIPVTVGDTTGQNITSYDFDLRFDPNVLQLVSGNPVSNTGTLSSNFTITPNANTPGKLVVSAFGIAPISGQGTLLNLNFQVIGQSGSSPLTWQMFTFNEGEPAAITTNGSVTIPSACSYALNPISATATASGGAGSFNVTAGTGCAWTATTTANWIQITNVTGSGSGTINYNVAANTGAARSATITVGGQTFTINQSAVIVTRRAPFDFDGDNKTDVGVFRPSDGSWWYLPSSNNQFRVYRFGVGTDSIVPGDYTGDGKTDIAVFRNDTWFIQRSEDNSFFSFPFGTSGDVPAPADYDADGKTDAAVFRPSAGVWYILNSGGSGTSIIPFAAAGDQPAIADYDGDGKADIAIFRPSDGSWWYLRSSDRQFRVFRFGLGTDKPVQGDYTGDGKADLAVWRPTTGEWFFQRSEDNSYYSVPFGAMGDIVAPGDYDGDGKFDTAVFRPSTANWFVQRSTAGILITSFGAAGDRPVPSAFVP